MEGQGYLIIIVQAEPVEEVLPEQVLILKEVITLYGHQQEGVPQAALGMITNKETDLKKKKNTKRKTMTFLFGVGEKNKTKTKMKKAILLMFFVSTSAIAQVGINTSTPDASAALDVESTTGGILIPRMTQVQRDAIASPSNGLMIYQTNAVQGFYYFNGNQWVSIANSSTGTEGFFSSTSIAADTYNENISISADLTNVDNWEVLYPDISGPSVSSFPIRLGRVC